MKKFFSIGLLVLFLLIASYFFVSDYTVFLSHKEETQHIQSQIQSKLKDFSFSDIPHLQHTQLHFVPDKKYLDTLVQQILSSKRRVYINVYMLTEKKVRDALLKVKKLGVDVRVILEKNVYKTPGVNQKTFDLLSSGSVLVQWSSNDEYSLDHAKYIIIDDLVIISTGNLTATTFSADRDIFFETDDSQIVQDIVAVFFSDFDKKYTPVYSSSLVISPWYSRSKIEYIIQHAKRTLDVYMPYIDDEELSKFFLAQAQKGVLIQIVTGQENKEDVFFDKLKKLGGKVTFVRKTIHAKSILVDKEYLYLGSENFSTSSLDENKEVGILLQEKSLIDVWQRFFNSDL